MKKAYLIAITFVLSACNGGPNKTNIEWIQNMMDQISIKAQDWNPKEPGQLQMRTPPPHTVARGHTPFKYDGDPVAAEKMANPFKNETSKEFQALGQKNYEVYCKVCHGVTGAGDGSVAEKMDVKPRNLINAEAKAYSDGRIYYAITAGRGVMGSYINQIPSEEARWAVVNFVRSLQR